MLRGTFSFDTTTQCSFQVTSPLSVRGRLTRVNQDYSRVSFIDEKEQPIPIPDGITCRTASGMIVGPLSSQNDGFTMYKNADHSFQFQGQPLMYLDSYLLRSICGGT
jgi:hypothetical protein